MNDSSPLRVTLVDDNELSVAGLTAIAAGMTDPVTASRVGMSALIAFFVAGLALLLVTKGPMRVGERASTDQAAGLKSSS